MFTKILLILLFLTNTAFAEHKCEFKRKWNTFTFTTKDNVIIRGNTRDYIIARDCYSLKYKGKKIDKKLTRCKCAYTNRDLIAKDGEVEHILPLSYIKRNNPSCSNILDIYNDVDNLVLVEHYINQKKSDKIGEVQGVNFPLSKRQCEFCLKWKKQLNCEKACRR